MKINPNSTLSWAFLTLFLMASQMAQAAAGCGDIISLSKVNKEPMEDIYRLNKSEFATGGMFAQILSGIPGVGIVAAVVADAAIGAVTSDVKQTNAEDKIRQEQQTKQYLDVYDVTVKPDFGNPITITIREVEVERFNLKKDVRAVIFYPNTDPLANQGNQATSRTRPSFSRYKAPEKPADGSAPGEEYNKICYGGQDATPYYIASGPWDPSSFAWKPMTDSEIREATNDYSREVYRLGLKRKNLVEQGGMNSEVAKIDLEELKFKLLHAQGSAYSRRMDDSANWRISKYDDAIKELQQQIKAVDTSAESKLLFKESADQARFRQSIALRLKEKAEKSTSNPVKEAVN